MATTLKERLERLMKEKRWEYADLVRESGESRSVVSQWLGRSSKTIHTIGKIEAAERLAAATGYLPLWIAKGLGPERAPVLPKRERVLADMVLHSSTLRDVARLQVPNRKDLSPEQQAEYLAVLDSVEQEARH